MRVKSQPCPTRYESEGAVAGPQRGWVDHREMVVHMDETRRTTIAQIEPFLVASAVVQFTPSQDDEERYAHISRVLNRFDYSCALARPTKGCLRRRATPAATAVSSSRGWSPAGKATVWHLYPTGQALHGSKRPVCAQVHQRGYGVAAGK